MITLGSSFSPVDLNKWKAMILLIGENIDIQKLHYSSLFYVTHYFALNSISKCGMNIHFLSNQQQFSSDYSNPHTLITQRFL